MKKALLAIIATSALLAIGADSEEGNGTAVSVVTNLVSETKTVKAWKRTFVLGREGGTVTDPTGQIADYATGAAMVASAAHQDTIAAGAQEGLTNALQRLYAVTNSIGNFTSRIYLAGDIQPDDTERQNLWCYIPRHSYANGVDTFWVWYSQDLGNAPKMRFVYRTETATESVDASWEAQNSQQWSNAVYTVDGFQNCRKLTVQRPESIGNIVLKIGAYPRFGTADGGFDFARKAFTVDDAEPYTGIFTNMNGMVEQYINGLFVGESGEGNEDDE